MKNPALAGKIIISGVEGSGIFMADGTSVIDSDGNVDAPVTSSDLTLSGTLDVTGISTLAGAVDISTESTSITLVDAQNGTPSIAQLLTGIIFHNSKTGAGTITFPTGTEISASITTLAVGDSFDVFYNNYGDQTVTLTGATGSTIKGTAAVTTTLNATIKFINTGANTWDLCTMVTA